MYSSRQDGGWGWVVVAAAFIAQMISDGITYGIGILYVDLMETFQRTSAEISSIVSLSYGSIYFVGPVAGILTNIFGYRFVTILGAFIEALGLLLSAFTPNLEFLYFSVGILIGVGGGMMYVASLVCVSTYFLSKRPLATGISSIGSSAGTFVFGFLYRACIDHYGWRGTLFVFASLMLNGIVCGTLFRPFSNNTSTDLNLTVDLENCETAQHLRDTNQVNDIESQSSTLEADNSCNSTCFNASHTCYYDVPHLPQNDISRDKKCANDINNRPPSTKDEQPERKASNDIPECSAVDNTCSRLAAGKDRPRTDHGHRELIVDRILETAKESQDDTYVISVMKTEPKFIDKARGPIAMTGERRSKGDTSPCGIKQQSRLRAGVRTVLGITNVNMFTDCKFVLFGISTFLYSFGYGIPFILLPDMAELNGFTPSEAAWVISEFGIAAIVGKIVFGALSQAFTHKDRHANTKLNSYSVILSGVAIACAPWTYSYHVLLVIGAAFGLFSAAVNTLVTLVLIELLGEEKLADAFGWLNLFAGVGFMTGPVVAGWLHDVTAAYNATFIAAGCSLILAGIVLFPIFITDSFRTVKCR